MKKTILSCAFMMALSLHAQKKDFVSLPSRVNVQSEYAPDSAIIDGEWVAVGTGKKHAIGYDYTRMFKGKPSYRFYLKADDNTLEGWSKGETKGRAELSYCYATAQDIAKLTDQEYDNAVKIKKVYHYGKGISEQASTRDYTFSVYIPGDLSNKVHTIFAQWHGMPTRTLLQTPEGEIKQVSDEEFVKLYDQMIFKKNTGHEKIADLNKKGEQRKDKNGNLLFKAGKPNGYLVEQGGYPPLAFGFADNHFYIKANSDRKWLTDKTDRCNANIVRTPIMGSETSEYKSSTIAYKMPFSEFPKDKWITFKVRIKWTKYGREAETILEPGMLDVVMDYKNGIKSVSEHIVKNEKIMIGRNDDDGYYFKFGIYRVGNSTEPVLYNLAGYSEK